MLITARNMALTSHNLSKDAMTATLRNGEVYRWGGSMWVGPMMKLPTDPKAPRGKRMAA